MCYTSHPTIYPTTPPSPSSPRHPFHQKKKKKSCHLSLQSSSTTTNSPSSSLSKDEHCSDMPGSKTSASPPKPACLPRAIPLLHVLIERSSWFSQRHGLLPTEINTGSYTDSLRDSVSCMGVEWPEWWKGTEMVSHCWCFLLFFFLTLQSCLSLTVWQRQHSLQKNENKKEGKKKKEEKRNNGLQWERARDHGRLYFTRELKIVSLRNSIFFKSSMVQNCVKTIH